MEAKCLFSDWETIFDTLPSGVIIFDAENHIIKTNHHAKRLLCLSVDEEIDTIQALPRHLEPLQQILLESPTDLTRSELALSLPSESAPRIIGFNLRTIQHDDIAPYRVFIFSDITQVQNEHLALDKIKEELYQSKKLASIGTMISGVAHELNNPLTGISMSAELTRMTLERLRKKLHPTEQATTLTALEMALQEVTKITTASSKAAALVNDLLTYSKPSQLNLTVFSIGSLLEEVIQALKSHPAFSQVKFQVQLLAGDSDVFGDKVKLEQVFYNLFKNASDATDGQGTLQVRVTESEGRLIVHVRDNGPGIDKTVINRIFDPFFTTKGNKGVGLGLSISYRTLEQHGGLLSVDSEPGQWTEFQVVLPKFGEQEVEAGAV